MTREGGQTTEATTTSATSVDLLTASSLTIAAAQPFIVVHGFRKTSGDASGVRVGLTLNATSILASGNTVTSSTDRAESGTMDYLIQARVTNYVVGFIRRNNAYISAGTTFAKAENGASTGLAATMPTVEITVVIIRAQVDNTSNTVGADEMHVYSLAAS